MNTIKVECVISDTDVFRRWLRQLKDPLGKVAVLRRIERARRGHFGDCKVLGKGVLEMRIPAGPGYRMYFMQTGVADYLLLSGGHKASQQRDIEQAQQIAQQIREAASNEQGKS